MFIVFGGDYHVFMVANRIGFVYSYMLVYENLLLWGNGYLRVEDIMDVSGILPPSLKFFRSCEGFQS